MEVIKKGTKRLVECLECGSVLKYYAGDVYKRYEPHVMYEMEGRDRYYITCPCGTEMDITSKISSRMTKKVGELKKLDDLEYL